MGNVNYFKRSSAGVTVPPQTLAVLQTDTKTGGSATNHVLTGVPASALLVLTTANQFSSLQSSIVTSSPSLTWTKAVDAQVSGSPNAEIWTATFTAGGSITVTSNWGTSVQTSVCYVLSGQDSTQVAGSVATAQTTASVNVATTKSNSIIFCVSVSWNAPDGGTGGSSTVYRGTPTQSLYNRDAAAATFWHYRYTAPTITTYTTGYSSPVDTDGGTSTAVLEIRSSSGVPPVPDTTPPAAFTVSSPGETHNTIDLTWGATTDNIGLANPTYQVFYGTTSNPTTLFTSTNSLSTTVTGLAPSTAYWLKVRATDTSNNFRDSNILNITTDAFVDVTPPNAPTITQPSKTATSILINWTLVTDDIGVTGYEIYRNAVLITTVANNITSYNYTGLSPSTTYALKIRAKDAAGNGADSNTLNITTNATADTTPPSAPVLAAPSSTDIGVTSVILNWTASTDTGGSGLAGYEVWKTGDVNEIAFTTSLTYTVTGLVGSTSYTFFVKALDNAGNETNSNQRAVTTDAPPVGGQPLTFTALTTDYRRYWGGPEFWGGGDGALTLGFTHSHRYRRFVWNDWEGDTQGSYRFTEAFGNGLKTFIDACRANKQLASFGVMTCYPGQESGASFHTYKEFNGTASAYPLYLHNLMQAESTKDWVSSVGGCWVPNFNSLNYINRFIALMQALNTFLNTTVSGQTYKYGDCVGYIDIRGMGAYGEWHSNGIISGNVNQYPGFVDPHNNPGNSGTFPSAARLIQIIDAQRNNLPSWPLCTILNSLDGNFPNGSNYGGTGFDNTAIPASVGQHMMNNGNAWGNIGWRRDQWGDINNYYRIVTQETHGITGIPTRWQSAPVTGEPPGYENSGTNVDGIHMRALNQPAGSNGNQIANQHPCMIGNSNYGFDPSCNCAININTWDGGASATEMRTAFTNMGCILRPTGGSVNLDINNLVITLNWRNFGLAPQYKKNWATTFEIRNSGGTQVWTNTSTFNPFLLLPSGTATTVIDSFARPSLTSGTYSLRLIIKDPANYLEPLQLGVTGRQTDGSYILASLNF